MLRVRGIFSRSGSLLAVPISLLGSTLLVSTAAFAQNSTVQSDFYEIETKYIFGFTEGSGIGLEGEKEFSPESVTRFGKRDGRYTANETKLEYEFTPSQYIQLEFGPIVTSHHIRDVTDLDNMNRTAFGGGFFELRYLLLDRPSSPLAVTLAVEPEWRRIDETSGQQVENFELETRINADLELAPKRLYAGLNLLYEPETTRDATGSWAKESTIGASAALSYRLLPSVVLGGEAWYLRHYDTIGISDYTGDAWYVGPNVYIQLNNKMFVTAAWNTQVKGHEVGEPVGLNLAEFSRQRVKLKFAVEF